MRFLTFLILASVGLILYAVISGYLSGGKPAGSAGLNHGLAGQAPPSSSLVEAHEQFQFGRLMMLDHGTVRQSVYDRSMWVPESYLQGTMLL